MPHADSSLVPSSINSKSEFWEHVHTQLAALLEGERNWVTNLANASSLVYSSLLVFPKYFGTGDRAVNWCGFYIDAALFPATRFIQQVTDNGGSTNSSLSKLLLGPFCGKPACQFIVTTPGKARGVCANSFLQRQTTVVPNVEEYPGHIPCDGETKSEIVCPLILKVFGQDPIVVGVLDLDCLALEAFDETDKIGLEKIADLVVNSCDW